MRNGGENAAPPDSVLVLAPIGRDAPLIQQALAAAEIPVRICRDMPEMCRLIAEGAAAAALLTEEAVTTDALRLLGQTLSTQEEWSDFPVLMLLHPTGVSQASWLTLRDLKLVGYATVLERPLRPMTLISAVRRMLRSRRRQFLLREYLTEREEREKTLEETARRERARSLELQTLLEVAPVGIAVAHDNECKLVTTNPVGAALLGISPHENLSQRAEEAAPLPYRFARDGQVLPPEELPLELAARQGTSARNLEVDIVRRDGRNVAASFSTSPLLDESGQIRGAICVFTDISDLKRGERALRESEQRFRTALESLPHIVWTALPDGEIDYSSPRLAEYAGQEAAASGGARWETLLHPDDRERVLAAWAQALASGERLETEGRLRRGDGAYRWFQHRAVPLRGQRGRIERWFCTASDVHDRRAGEEQRQMLLERERAAREDAERISRMKDEFLSTLSHELRTPLTSILGWSQMLRRGSLSPEEQFEAVQIIEANARSQRAIIEDLLEMSRIITGKLRLRVRRIDLRRVIQAAMETVRPAAMAKQLTLAAALRETPLLVRGDPDRLQQIAWNLLSNAAKFTPAGGRIEVALEEEPGFVVLRVSDTGRGIKPEFAAQMFERFRQYDASTTRRHGGLGLGLSIVKQLAELHGGSVSAESPGENQGATFRVRLPVPASLAGATPDDFEEESERTEDFEPHELEGLRVLIVEDEPNSRILLQRLLVERGVEVYSAGSAAEGMDIWERADVDLLISDIAMPEEDGYSLIRRIRSEEDEEECMPAIALTAFARAEDRDEALQAGFQAHLPKPVEPADLLTAVVRLTRRRERVARQRPLEPAPPPNQAGAAVH